MHEIVKQEDGSFDLMKDGDKIGNFLTLEDAEKAQAISEGKPIKTWVDDGEGLDYPESTDNYHSGIETPLTLEQRFDAVLKYLADVHGFHLPDHLAPKE